MTTIAFYKRQIFTDDLHLHMLPNGQRLISEHFLPKTMVVLNKEGKHIAYVAKTGKEMGVDEKAHLRESILLGPDRFLAMAKKIKLVEENVFFKYIGNFEGFVVFKDQAFYMHINNERSKLEEIGMDEECPIFVGSGKKEGMAAWLGRKIPMETIMAEISKFDPFTGQNTYISSASDLYPFADKCKEVQP